MTERAFRRRFVQLWFGFAVVAFVVSRVLLMSRLELESQRTIYEAIWLGTVVAAIALYRKGSITDFAERERILAKANFERIGRFRIFQSMLFLGMLAVGLGLGIWDARYESWKVWGGLLVVAPINLLWMWFPFVTLRNAQLWRMQDVG